MRNSMGHRTGWRQKLATDEGDCIYAYHRDLRLDHVLMHEKGRLLLFVVRHGTQHCFAAYSGVAGLAFLYVDFCSWSCDDGDGFGL